MSLMVKVARAQAMGRGMPGVGDPGPFGFIGKAISKVASIVKHVPGPIGWAAGAVSKFLPTKVQQIAPPTFTSMPAYAPPQMPVGLVPPPGFAAPVTGMGPGAGVMPTTVPQAAIGAPSGYHVNESDYFLKDGTFVPAGSRWVKNRKRNPLNPRAASKAISRIEQLKRATSRFSRITIRKKCCDK